MLTNMEKAVLKACAGQNVQLPYNDEQRAATARLLDERLIVNAMEDDQPTAFATILGKMLLAQLGEDKPTVVNNLYDPWTMGPDEYDC